MTPEESIECGYLLEKRDKGIITSDEMKRLLVLQAIALQDLPTWDTAIVAAQRTEVEWAQRWGDLGRWLEKAGKDVAEVALKVLLQQLPNILAGKK